MASQYRGPLRCYRIANGRRPIFDGAGSFLNGGRWNSPGARIIYAAETYAGALLERLVHSAIGHPPRDDAWVEIRIPGEVLIEEIRAEDVPNWDAPDNIASRAFGDRWYAERRSAVLAVPSIVTRGIERNLVINQEHPEFPLLWATNPQGVRWDARLFGARIL